MTDAETKPKPTVSLKTVANYFGMTLPEMKNEWVPLPQADKDQILAGIGNGSYTY